MPRYFFNISYNGTNYHGWQIQSNAISVQEVLQDGLSKILKSKVEVIGSGRTDTGVHAKQQSVHFDFGLEISARDLLHKLNGILPQDISANSIKEVKPDAHARFDATERAYQYFINQAKNPFFENQSYQFSFDLDVELMNKAASKLLGEQDFESFSKVKTEVNTFICTIKKAEWFYQNDQLIFEVRANRFLRGMVRALVGTLLDVGRRKLSVKDFVNIIKSKDRTKAARAVPPHGLFLTEVYYPEDIYI